MANDIDEAAVKRLQFALEKVRDDALELRKLRTVKAQLEEVIESVREDLSTCDDDQGVDGLLAAVERALKGMEKALKLLKEAG
jgi:hypothetical protein